LGKQVKIAAGEEVMSKAAAEEAERIIDVQKARLQTEE